jgi:hypothetical protein
MTKAQATLSLLSKLGSIAVHADEFISSDGHPFDREAFISLLHDSEVVDFLNDMIDMALLPVKRKP